MGEVPEFDREQWLRWEWFRRAQWPANWKAKARVDGVSRALESIAQSQGARILLHFACGLGERVVALEDVGLNLVGADAAAEAVECARKLARDENVPATFFHAAAYPDDAPHPFDGILDEELHLEPDWERLGARFRAHAGALNPGGFLLFRGPTAEDTPPPAPAAGGAARGEADPGAEGRAGAWPWSLPAEEVAWSYRDGKRGCARVLLRRPAADFVDEEVLHVVDAPAGPRLERTARRLPGYWTWSHWEELTRAAGFASVETRLFPAYGEMGAPLRLNVAWRGEGPVPTAPSRPAPYRD